MPTAPALTPESVPLARLFAMAYRQLVDDMHVRLRARGWVDVRPAYGFVLLAAREEPTTTTALASMLGMTKQAASKLVTGMVDAGLLTEAPAGGDARVRPLALSGRGRQLLATVEEIYAELEGEWAGIMGRRALERVRFDLTSAVTAANAGGLPAIRPLW